MPRNKWPDLAPINTIEPSSRSCTLKIALVRKLLSVRFANRSHEPQKTQRYTDLPTGGVPRAPQMDG
jgi:hypothetical protein